MSQDTALAGRIPVAFDQRILRRYREFLLTSGTLGAASYAYLVGMSLAALGTTWIGLAGYMVGLVLGTGFVALAVGTLSYRAGVDAVDASKSALGTRGAVLMLLGAYLSAAGWANILLAMTSRGIVALMPSGGAAVTHAESLVSACALALVALVWLLLRRGAKAMEHAASYGALVQMGLALLVIALVLWRWGLSGSLLRNVAPEAATTADRGLQLSLAVEFGFANALGMVPFMGGLSRLVMRRSHTVGPVVLGYPLLGCTLVACAGAMAGMATGQQELGGMLFGVAGPRWGLALLAVVLLTNVGTMVAQFYIAGLSLQQIRLFSGLRWRSVVMLALLPSVLLAFATRWLLDHVMSLLAYGGVLFVGTSAVLFVDYFILRRQRVRPAHLFAVAGQGDYWFRGGVNWAALIVIIGCCPLYLWWFDPLTLRTAGPFPWLGACVPTEVVGGALYWLLMRLWVIPSGRGVYREAPDAGVEVAM